jgi:hypothetical protein
MPGLCRAPGCDSPTTSRYSVYCSRHQSRLRRQVDVAQEAITAADLKEYLKLVRARIEKNRESPAWAQLEARWVALVEHAKGIISGFRAGKAGASYTRRAATEVLKVAESAQPRDVIEVLLAMYVMEELEQRRFRSDPGFRFQLVRRIRALADVNAGTRYDHKSNKVRRVYREMSPRAVATMGQWLADTLGGAGARLAKMEREEQERQDRERSQLHESLASLK